jgi:hypothetical protein
MQWAWTLQLLDIALRNKKCHRYVFKYLPLISNAETQEDLGMNLSFLQNREERSTAIESLIANVRRQIQMR